MTASACKSCGAAIYWERTKNGKPIPVDAASSADGNVEMRGGVACVVPPAELAQVQLQPVSRYKSHFATCKHAAQHRKATTS